MSGSRPVRLADVAREAGVSQGTASNVFNKPDLVREEVRERVLAAAAALGYQGPDPRGRLLRAGKADAIGVVVSEELAYFFADPYARRFLAGIAEVCDAQGSGLLLISAGRMRSDSDSVRTALVDGFIVYSLEDGAHLLEPVRARRLPYVSVDFEGGAGSVRVDDRRAAADLARHLIGLGHRRFGVLGFAAPDVAQDENGIGALSVEDALEARFSVKRDRLAGFMDALGEAGIGAGDVSLVETPNARGLGQVATRRLLDAAPETTAILAMSDVLALGALDHAAQAGIAVPDRLSLTGFDGLPLSQRAEPSLTTMRQPIAEKGRRAAAMLFAGKSDAVRLDVEMMLGGSTGPAQG
ncbi:MAG: LacI family DNA-binding transcriptional regulator [Pseudomonadota bacterium]